MRIDKVRERMYFIILTPEQENLVTEWAHISHVSNEEVIEDWLSESLEKHKIIRSPIKARTNHGTETLSTEGIDNG